MSKPPSATVSGLDRRTARWSSGAWSRNPPMIDVLVIGAGPAGCVAATLLARAGARVRMLDRSTFPRPKLCGDTVNPGTVALLRRLRLAGGLETRGLRIDGMAVTGASGTRVEA